MISIYDACCNNIKQNNPSDFSAHFLTHFDSDESTEFIQKKLTRLKDTSVLEKVKRDCYGLLANPENSTELNNRVIKLSKSIQQTLNAIRYPSALESALNTLEEQLGITQQQVIAISYSGSCATGHTTEQSDTDICVIYQPETIDTFDLRTDKVLKKDKSIPLKDNTHKSDSGELDLKVYKLRTFVWNCLQRNDETLNVLHSDNAIFTTETFDALKKHRALFYSKEDEFFHRLFSPEQNKFCPPLLAVREDDIQELKNIIAQLSPPEFCKNPLKMHWPNLPKTAHVYETKQHSQSRYCIFGGQFSPNQSVKIATSTLSKKLPKYENPQEIYNHKKSALLYRIILQQNKLMTNGDYEHPIAESALLLDIRNGDIPSYLSLLKTIVQDYLSTLESRKENSPLPSTKDYDFWEQWLSAKRSDVLATQPATDQPNLTEPPTKALMSDQVLSTDS